MSEQRVEAVERALTIIEAFKDGQDVLTLTEISKATGFYKSTVLRLCASLERFGYIRRRKDGTYQLGASLWRMGSHYRRAFDLGSEIRPELKVLADETGETASFYIKDGDVRVCLYRQNSNKEIRHHLDEGSQLPLDVGAAGRVLLAFSGGEGSPYEAIRTDGFYVSHGERNSDIFALAVPVFDTRGRLRGSLSVSGLRSRLTDALQKNALAALRQGAQSLSRALPIAEDL